jgi:hypothetical protein
LEGGKEMKVTTDTKLGQLAERAMKSLDDFFDADDHTGKDIGAARIATAIISAWTRQAQTRSAEKTTLFMVARELAGDREQLAEYIRLTMPDLAIVKALPKGRVSGAV